MFTNWTEKYKEFSREIKLISQIGTFFVSIFSFLSLAYLINLTLSTFPNISDDLWSGIIISVIFHLTIGTIFAARFVSLFFCSEKSFWFSQIVWFVCILTIAGYFVATRYNIYGSFYPPKSNVSFGMDDYPIIFLHASYSFAVLLFIYFFTSPLRQFITAIVALIKSK